MPDTSQGPGQGLDPWVADHIIKTSQQLSQLTALGQATNERVILNSRQIEESEKALSAANVTLVDVCKRVITIEETHKNEQLEKTREESERKKERGVYVSETVKSVLAALGGAGVAKAPDFLHWLFTFHH